MITVDLNDMNLLIAFWLGFAKLFPIAFQFPLFDNKSVPNTVKVLGLIVINYAFFPYTQKFVLRDMALLGQNSFWVLTIFYSVVGIIIGFFVKSIMQIFLSAGSIISQEVGFGAAKFFDPNFGEQVGIFEQLISWIVIIMILSTGALYPMFNGLLRSFDTLSFFGWNNTINFYEFFLNFFKSAFLASLTLATPLIFTNLLIMTVLGIISRVVPQMNVLMVSFVVNIGLGLLVFLACSEEITQMSYDIYTQKLGDWFKFII